MSEIKFTDSDMEELKNAFLIQAEETLEGLSQTLIALESNQSEENWKSIKRAFHTLKGDSKAMGFDSLSAYAHKVEDLIEDLKGSELDRASFDMLFECADAAETLLTSVASGSEPDISDIVARIDAYRYSAAKHKRTGEAALRTETQKHVRTLLRIEPERVDKIMDLIGELVIRRSMLNQIITESDDTDKQEMVSNLEELNSSLEISLNDLQRSVMKVRMLPIGHVFRRFPRIVRDLSQEMGKNVRLHIEGEQTELDKSVIDVIMEPLMHLVRNSIDHGIEMPETRRASGKPEEGSLYLRAFHQGNQIVLEIEDDGKGIDPDVLRDKAVRKGVIKAEDAKKLSDKEAIDLIFTSGFSTREKVTEVSGRGVGMDIVNEVVEANRGMVEVESEKSKGTKVTLRLPLTLAIMKTILFEEGERTFAIPMTAVTEIVKAAPEEIETLTGSVLLKRRDGLVPVISVQKKTEMGIEDITKPYVIVIGVAQLKAGVVADRVIGEENLVVKALDDKASLGIAAGASILGNGNVVPILDPLLLIKKRQACQVIRS